jgi:hypothetical protein
MKSFPFHLIINSGSSSRAFLCYTSILKQENKMHKPNILQRNQTQRRTTSFRVNLHSSELCSFHLDRHFFHEHHDENQEAYGEQSLRARELIGCFFPEFPKINFFLFFFFFYKTKQRENQADVKIRNNILLLTYQTNS